MFFGHLFSLYEPNKAYLAYLFPHAGKSLIKNLAHHIMLYIPVILEIQAFHRALLVLRFVMNFKD